MENYYYFLKNKYNIEPKYDFTDKYKCSCEYDGKTYTSEISCENDIKGRIAYGSVAILLLLQLNDQISLNKI
jgi:hypothetical protein